MLGLTALDAFIAGLSTAFFGSLVAGGAYLLKQQLVLREQVGAIVSRIDTLGTVERVMQALDGMERNPEEPAKARRRR